MIEKRVFNDSYDWDDAVGRIVPVGSRGADIEYIRKEASSGVFAERISQLKPDKAHTILQVIALGDQERYGFNRNGDGVSEADNKARHHTFVTNGTVFKNHKNKHPSLGIGEVIDSAHHDEAGRTELLLKVSNDKGADLLDDFEKTGQLPVSMGLVAPFDVCTNCKHKAATPKKHCDCVKHHLGEVTEDGVKIAMMNPNPTFFDISLLKMKPADRIGWTICKVANASSVVGGHELPTLLGIYDTVKLAVMSKVAEIEKRFPGLAQKATPDNLSARTKTKLAKHVVKCGAASLIGNLHSKGWLLSPRDFGEVILGLSIKEAAEISSKPVAESEEDPVDIESLDGDEDPVELDLDSSDVADLDSCCKLSPARAQRNIIHITIVQPSPIIKVGSAAEYARGLSEMYTYYKVACAVRHRADPSALRSIAFA